MHSVGSVSSTWSGMDLAVRTSQAPASSGRPVFCSNTANEQKERKKGDSLELEKRPTQSLALAPPTSCLALSLSSRLNILPIALLGISSMNATPPLSCL